MFNLISFLENIINDYIKENENEFKENTKNKLNKIYDSDDISKKIINIIYNDIKKDFNYCFICKNTFCDNCSIKC